MEKRTMRRLGLHLPLETCIDFHSNFLQLFPRDLQMLRHLGLNRSTIVLTPKAV